MKQLTLITSGLSLFLVLNLAAVAQPNEGNKFGHGGISKNDDFKRTRHERLKDVLNLTDEQSQKLESLKLEHQKKNLPLQNELNEKEARMQTLETAENVDMKAINSLIDDMGVVKTKIAKERAAHHQEIRKILTPEQRIQFDLMGHQRKIGKEKRGKN